MIRKILIPSDGSALTQRAVKSGIELAKATGASVIGLAITDPYPLNMYGTLMLSGVEALQDHNDHERKHAERQLASLAKAAKAAGVEYYGSSVTSTSPADAIVATAEQEHCDLICLATRDRHDLLGAHLNRKTAWILTHSRIPVLLCH